MSNGGLKIINILPFFYVSDEKLILMKMIFNN